MAHLAQGATSPNSPVKSPASPKSPQFAASPQSAPGADPEEPGALEVDHEQGEIDEQTFDEQR